MRLIAEENEGRSKGHVSWTLRNYTSDKVVLLTGISNEYPSLIASIAGLNQISWIYGMIVRSLSNSSNTLNDTENWLKDTKQRAAFQTDDDELIMIHLSYNTLLRFFNGKLNKFAPYWCKTIYPFFKTMTSWGGGKPHSCITIYSYKAPLHDSAHDTFHAWHLESSMRCWNGEECEGYAAYAAISAHPVSSIVAGRVKAIMSFPASFS